MDCPKERSGMKKHWQSAHADVWQQHLPLVKHWCRQWSKTIRSPCQVCGVHVVDYRQHAGQAQCTAMVQAAMVTQPARRTYRTADHPLRSDAGAPGSGTGRNGTASQDQGKGKGKSKGKQGRGGNGNRPPPKSEGSSDSSELRRRPSIASVWTRASFWRPGSVTKARQLGDAWRQKNREAPTTLTMSLEMAVMECQHDHEQPRSQEGSRKTGSSKGGCLDLSTVEPGQKREPDHPLQAIPHKDFCQGVEDFLEQIRKCNGLTRFKALQELTPDTKDAAVPFALDVSRNVVGNTGEQC